MEKISILVPCYNEENNINPMAKTLTDIMKRYYGKYDYEILFRDNASTDNSLNIMRDIAMNDKHIKIIANARNYGVDSIKDTYYGRISGEICISIPCDFQEPPELIPEFISWYEKGYEVVAGQKCSSKEGKIKYFLRQLYYRIIQVFSDIPQIPNMSGIFLCTKRILNLYYNNNRYETFRYFLTDLGCEIKLIQYEQNKRRSGKSSYNIWRSLSFSISSLIDVSTTPLRIATIFGILCAAMSFFAGLTYLIMKLIWWDRFSAGMVPVMIAVFFLGSIQISFIGLIGEYVGTILKRVTPNNPPLVKELINFDNPDDDPYLIKSVQDNIIETEIETDR
ncbi:MAG: glycosyltransferase family 2 protein [Spirochaetaceae bacterium]|nr:glycosyltransferase family 2 protein [Spirochaetaceae bacterium]